MQKGLQLLTFFSLIGLLSNVNAYEVPKTPAVPAMARIMAAGPVKTQPGFKRIAFWTWERVRSVWERMEKSVSNVFHRLFKTNEQLDKHAQNNMMDELTIKGLKDAAAEKNLNPGHTAMKKIDVAEKKVKETKDAIKKAKDQYVKTINDAHDKVSKKVKDVGAKIEDSRAAIDKANKEVEAA